MKRSAWVPMLLGSVVVATLAALALHESPRPVLVSPVVVAALNVSVLEEGKTRLRHRYVVSAPVAGTVRRIDLEPGDAVNAGDVVAELEPLAGALLDPQARARARAEATAAEASERAAQQRVRAAVSARNLTRREAARVAELGAAASASQREAAQLRADEAEAERAAAEADHASARQRAEAARAVIDLQGSADTDRVLALTAPISGVVIARPQESRAAVAAAQPLLELGDPQDLDIAVEALSTIAVQLRPGMTARVLRWGGEHDLQARVVRIEPAGFTKISALGVEEQRTRVLLELISPREQWQTLGDAYRVEVEFLLRARHDVLQVPSNALFRDGGRWAVFVIDAGRARRRFVELGDRAGAVSEIVSGAKVGEIVIQNPDDRIDEGTRVEAVAP